MDEEALRPYEFHGLSFHREGTQAKARCPFCDGSFQVNLVERERDGRKISPGLWGCWGCGRKGNRYSFLSELVEASVAYTTGGGSSRLAELSAERGIGAETLSELKVCLSLTTGDWLIPAYGTEARIIQLYAWRFAGGKKRPMATAGIGQVPYLLDRVTRAGDLWLVEGHWDGMSLWEVMRSCKLDHDVVAVPGWTNVNEKMLWLLAGRKVIAVLHNDEQGRKGIARLVELVEKSGRLPPESLSMVIWRGGDPKDIRDVCKLPGATSQKVYAALSARLREVPFERPGPKEIITSARECNSWSRLVEDFDVHMQLSDALRAALAVMMATMISTKLNGEPLWVYVVGPPSSGKSTLAEACVCHPRWAYAQDTITPTSLVSGLRIKDGDGRLEDVSVLSLLDGKTLLVKDFTAILRMPAATLETLLGTLRGVYDRVYRRKFGGEREMREYLVKFSILACTTYEIRTLNHSVVGERFLHVDIVDQSKRRKFVDTALNVRAIDQLEREMAGGAGDVSTLELRRSVLGFLDHLSDWMSGRPIPTISVEYKQRISALAELCSFMRSRVRRDRDQKLLIRPTRELGPRLARQLAKLAIALSIVYQQQEVDERVLAVVRRVAMNTSAGFVLDIVNHLLSAGVRSVGDTSSAINLDPANVRHVLRDMQELGIVRSVNGSSKKAAQWEVADGVRNLWRMSIGKVEDRTDG